MAPLPSLASHKPVRNSLGTARSEGKQQGSESVGLTGCVRRISLCLALRGGSPRDDMRPLWGHSSVSQDTEVARQNAIFCLH